MDNKLTLIGILVLILGISLTIASFHYERYSDESAYKENLRNISRDDENRNEKFNELREEYLTPKDNYFDYGISFVICGLTALLLSVIGIKKIKTPSKRWMIVLIGVLASITTNIAISQFLLMDVSRGRYFHNMHSMGLTFLAIHMYSIMLLGWVGLNSIGFRKPFNTSTLIFPIKITKINCWYLIIAGLSLLITICYTVYGKFWFLIPSLLWIYFYISILAGRQSALLKQS